MARLRWCEEKVIHVVCGGDCERCDGFDGDYEDYFDFYEPSDFDSQIDEFKEHLRHSVKKEILDELNRLRKENKKLQDIKHRMNQIEYEYSAALKKAKDDAIRERFDKIVEACSPVYYCPTFYHIKKPKCDKCDENRDIPYMTPLGRKAKERCTCAETITQYKPEPYYVCEIREHQGIIYVWNKPYDKGDGYSLVVIIKERDICDDKPFESIEDKYKAYFRDEKRCMAYCEWLNTQEIAKEQGEDTELKI